MALHRIAFTKTEATKDVFTSDELSSKSNCLADVIVAQRALVE